MRKMMWILVIGHWSLAHGFWPLLTAYCLLPNAYCLMVAFVGCLPDNGFNTFFQVSLNFGGRNFVFRI
jgi:hypothetical protein